MRQAFYLPIFFSGERFLAPGLVMTYRIIDTLTLAALILGILFFSFYSDELMDISTQVWFLNRPLIDATRGYEFEFLTANFAHFNWHHALENIIALVLIWYLFFNAEINTSLHKLTLLFIPMFGTTFGVYLFDNVNVYGGMSGALHGLATGAALIRFIKGKEFIAFAVLIAIIVKVVIDFYFPALSFNNLTSSLYGSTMALDLGPKANFSVCASSHLAGALSGCLIAALLLIGQAVRPKKMS